MDSPQTIEVSDQLLSQLYLVIAVTFLLGLAFIVFCVYYLRKLYAKEFAIQRIKSEQKQLLIQANMESQEQERARIASDLHDDVGANLSTVKLYVSHLQASKDQEVATRLLKVTDMLDETIRSVRQISHHLIPADLEQFGLFRALENLCEKVDDAGDLSVTYQFGDTIPFRHEHQLHVYRIVQELINNTLKHASATRINLHITRENGQIILNYTDNGKGIQPTQEGSKGGIGLKNIHSRAEIIGALVSQPIGKPGFQLKLTYGQFV